MKQNLVLEDGSGSSSGRSKACLAVGICSLLVAPILTFSMYAWESWMIRHYMEYWFPGVATFLVAVASAALAVVLGIVALVLGRPGIMECSGRTASLAVAGRAISVTAITLIPILVATWYFASDIKFEYPEAELERAPFDQVMTECTSNAVSIMERSSATLKEMKDQVDLIAPGDTSGVSMFRQRCSSVYHPDLEKDYYDLAALRKRVRLPAAPECYDYAGNFQDNTVTLIYNGMRAIYEAGLVLAEANMLWEPMEGYASMQEQYAAYADKLHEARDFVINERQQIEVWTPR